MKVGAVMLSWLRNLLIEKRDGVCPKCGSEWARKRYKSCGGHTWRGYMEIEYISRECACGYGWQENYRETLIPIDYHLGAERL